MSLHKSCHQKDTLENPLSYAPSANVNTKLQAAITVEKL